MTPGWRGSVREARLCAVPKQIRIPLRGPGREPVDLHRTLVSHGTFSLPPALLDEERGTAEITIPLPRGRPRTIRIEGSKIARVEVLGPRATPRVLTGVEDVTRRLLNLDEDLSGFYALAAEDPDLAWVTSGAGRMARAPTVFEDVIKTLTTTNCSWALTTKMVTTLVRELGEPAPGAREGDWRGRAFPTPEAMAQQDDRFYREVVRTGYRAPHFVALARGAADGSLDLEALRDPSVPDEEVEARLLALPGIGPYAAAHVGLTLGRYRKLILDSWTRPTFARLAGYKRIPKDSTIERRFRRYGPWAGLAFWCFLTRSWVDSPPPE
jgi:3-methyladenine DNA glycosylase/8-oxoguanine DNA glycosylase